MQTYTPGLGIHVARAAAEMVALASETGEPVEATFNTIRFVVRPGDTAEAAVERWDTERDRQAVAYAQSPAGKAAARKRADAVAEKQAACDTLVGNLLAVDFNDPAEALRWLMAFETVAGDIDVSSPTADILHVLAEHGYLPNVNVGEAFDADDPENVVRYIIGQGLDGIARMGCPHPVLQKFAAEWFESRAAG